MMSKEACPFCGQPPKEKIKRDEYRYYCGNRDCPIQEILFTVEEWNTRAIDDHTAALRAEVEALRARVALVEKRAFWWKRAARRKMLDLRLKEGAIEDATYELHRKR